MKYKYTRVQTKMEGLQILVQLTIYIQKESNFNCIPVKSSNFDILKVFLTQNMMNDVFTTPY